MSDPAEWQKVMTILAANKKKSFVDRILHPNKYPRLDLGNGDYATHQMAWTTAGNKYRVYPTVLWTGKELKQFKPDEAYQQVLKTGNYIDFDTPEEADWFSQRYKAAWGE